MTAPPPRRPWWKRKRTWAALAVWLAVAYPCGFGLLCYADGRGRVSRSWYPPLIAAYAPFFVDGAARPSVLPYAVWCFELGKAHAASD